MTSTYWAEPSTIMPLARVSPYPKPAQPAEMSKAAGLPAPTLWAISVAMAGVCLKCETVETITPPICSGVIPASAMALPDASTDIAATVSWSEAQ